MPLLVLYAFFAAAAAIVANLYVVVGVAVVVVIFFCILHKLMLQPQQQTNEQTIRRTNMKLPIRHPRTTLRTCMRMSTVHTRSTYTERKNHSKYNIFGSRVLNICFIYSLATFEVLQTRHYLVTSGVGGNSIV